MAYALFGLTLGVGGGILIGGRLEVQGGGVKPVKYDNYKGEIEYNGERFAFMPATVGDVEQLAEMYSDVAITDKNYRVKLNPNHEESYSRTGGILAETTRESIETAIREKSSCFAVIKTLGGRIIACLRLATHHPQLMEFHSGTLPGCANCACSIAREHEVNTMMYIRELLFRQGKLHNAAYTLFYTVFMALERHGYTHCLYVLYDLKEYRIGGKKTAIAMLDQTAFDTCAKMGGRFLGNLPEYDVTIGRLLVRASPKVICLEFAKVLPTLEQKLNDVGINIFLS